MPDRRITGRTGAAAALGGLAAAEATAAAVRGPSLLDTAGRLVVDVGPRPIVDVMVRLLRTSDKPAIRAAVAGTVLLTGACTARLLRRDPARAAVLAAAAGAAAWAGLRRPPRRVAATLAAAAAGALGARSVLRHGGSPGRDAVAAGAAATLLWSARRQFARHERSFDRSQGSSAAGIYTVDVNVDNPRVDPMDWRLRICGLVQHPARWTMTELRELGVEEFDAVMVCIHIQLGWHRAGNARWAGVPLSRLLAAAGPADGATTLVTRAVDGYTISLPLELLDRLPGYVVVGMNGGPLPVRHGFPARIFVPGLYGQYTGVKWLAELELVRGPYPDYWARRGWPREPVPVRPMSRIDGPADGETSTGPLLATGVAWAPPHGLDRVEIAVDDGVWHTVELADEQAPVAWREWRHRLDLSAGPHRIRTRAVSRDGTVQAAMPRPPFPSGVSGYHTVTIVHR